MIYMVYTWYILGLGYHDTMYIRVHQTGYTTWYILRLGYATGMYIHKVYTWYIHGYTWYIIWCMYMAYTWFKIGFRGISRPSWCQWIFLAFWNQISWPGPARAAGLIQCAHACGWSRVFYSTRHHGNCATGKGGPQNAQPDCSQRSPPVAQAGASLVAAVTAKAVAVTAEAAAVLLVAFLFPSLVVGNNLNLGERWGRGCLQDRWPMCWRALTLACSENWENKLISNCNGDRSCSSEEPERLEWLFIAI